MSVESSDIGKISPNMRGMQGQPELAVVTSAAVETTPTEKKYPLSLHSLNEAIYGDISPAHEWAINNVEETDWQTRHWSMDNVISRRRAGQALAAGIPGFVEFGNFKALMFHPHIESMKTVNVAKGRDEIQVASVVTTKEHIESLVDWDKLPGGLRKEDVMNMIHSFYDRTSVDANGSGNPHAEFAGPFGFRFPAADHIPNHLVSVDKLTGLRSVQLIAPGYDCLSNDVVANALKAMKDRDPNQPNYLAITSANPSGRKTRKDEPAHYLRRGIQAEFHNYEPGFFIMGHRTENIEEEVRNSYKHHDPNSTTILDFTRASAGEYGWPVIHMARHGSLSDEHTEMIVNSFGMELVIDEKARPKLELRDYNEDFLKQPDISNQHPDAQGSPRRNVIALFRPSRR